MSSKIVYEPYNTSRKDKAMKNRKSYCVNKDVMSTLPKSGGNDIFRPSVIVKKKF